MTVDNSIMDRVETWFDDQVGVSVVEWDNTPEGNAYAILDVCPFEHLHTSDTALTEHVRAYLEPNIQIHCFHKSCKDEIDMLSKSLWMLLDRPQSQGGVSKGIKGRKLSPEQEAKAEERRLLNEQKDAVISARESGLLETMYSPVPTPTNATKLDDPYGDFIRRLYQPSDVLWSGTHDGSGEWAIDKGKCCFMSARELCDIGKPLHPFISNSTYKNTSKHRKASEVVQKRYIVLEWDGLTPEEPCDKASIDENLRRSGVLFSYVQDLLGLDHYATVFSGGKSLHMWVAMPSDDKIKWLRHCANELKFKDSISGLDTACMGASQPCRTPSYFRAEKDKEQKLIYLKPIE